MPSSGFIARPLPMLLAASRAYLRRAGTPREPTELERYDCLGFTYLAQRDRWRIIGRDGEHAVRVRSRLEINNGEALREAAIAGAGIVMQWQVLLARDLAAGRLVRVLPRYAPPPRAAQLVYAPDRWRSPELQHFVAFVLQRLGPGTERSKSRQRRLLS